ncbi:unnamed protein product [Sympodiomycopsis kandeliae]
MTSALPFVSAMAGLDASQQRLLSRLIHTSVAPSRTTPFAQRRLMTARSSPMNTRAMPISLGQLRLQSTQPQTQSSSTSSTPSPPPSSSSSSSPSSQQKTGDQQSTKTPASPPVYQEASSTPASRSSPPSTSDISRVAPAATYAASERGSFANQSTVAISNLNEKQALEKQEKEEEERRLREMGVVKRTWLKVKEEAAHYWHGTKLLGKEIRISARLLRRLLSGYSLTRREHRQLKRTTADLLRLIPFAPFIIIPFGELLLPVAIKIFPNMLPSTFESKFAVEAKRRGLIKVRLEMAKFLQGTIREGGIQATDKVKTSDEFKEFFRKVRATGEQPSDQDVIKVAKLFDDDLTLDNLTRPQLVSMCRYMQINAFGTDNYLRYQIRHKLNRIKRDDIVIQHEGSEHMSLHELQSACANRGIQTLNLAEDRLREELRQWIELHITQRISGTLLILSKAFNYMPTGDENVSTQLKSLEVTLSSLPDNLINEAELNVSKDSATNKQRLEVLEQQEELIEDEAEQEAAEEEARKSEKKRRDAEKKRLAKEEEEAKALLPRAETHEESPKASESDPEELKMTNEQLTELGEALSLMSAKSSVLKEREELAELIKEVSNVPEEDASESVSQETASQAKDTSSSQKAASDSSSSSSEKGQEGESVSAAGEEAATSTSQSAGSRSLAKKVKSMLEHIDRQLEEYEKEVGSKMHIIEASPTGKISVDDLEQALRLIKHRPSEDVLERLVDSMDKDKDGLIPLAEVVALAEQESGLGIVREDSIKDITGQGRKLGEQVRGVNGAGSKSSSTTSPSASTEASQSQKQSLSTSTPPPSGKSGKDASEKDSKNELRREDIVKDE